MSKTVCASTLSVALAVCAGGCSNSSNNVLPQPTVQPMSPIKHIVVIVQENRSFENMFAGWAGADAPLVGYGTTSHGKRFRVHLREIRYSEDHDICHVWQDAITAWNNGKMDGFNREHSGVAGACNESLAGTFPYSYMNHEEIKPYRDLASQYVLADHMFPTEFGTSFTAHQDLIAGTTEIRPGHSLVNTPNNFPWGCDASAGTSTPLVDSHRVVDDNTNVFPCFTQYPTIADRLDAAHVSWRYYVQPLSAFSGQIWNPFEAIKRVRYSSAWKNVVTPDMKALSAPSRGDLPSVTWIIPDLKWADYPVITKDWGPSWVGDLVNGIGKSQYWNSTAVVVLWDDWGGWYDNVSPPQEDYVGLAIRVPCIIISPYARKGYVSHTQYEYGSILKFIEETFNLPSLHATDDRANSIIDSLDFTQAPRSFVPIATKHPASFFLQQTPSLEPPDSD